MINDNYNVEKNNILIIFTLEVKKKKKKNEIKYATLTHSTYLKSYRLYKFINIIYIYI